MIATSDIASIKARIRAAQTKINSKIDFIRTTEFQISQRQQEILNLKDDNEILQKTMNLFKLLSEQENEKSKSLFITLVNYGLNTVFGPEVKFDLDRKQYATGTFYFPILIKDGKREALFSSGGGILDLVSFLCRVVVLVSFYPANARTLRLDEPFKNLSVEYRESTARLLEALSEQFNIQLIMVTHMTFLTELNNSSIFKTEMTKEGTVYTKEQ